MSHAGYVAAAWGVTLLAGGLYAMALRLRGRRLLRRAQIVAGSRSGVDPSRGPSESEE